VRFDDVKVKLTALPNLSTTEMMQKKFGVSVQSLTDDLAEALGIRARKGC